VSFTPKFTGSALQGIEDRIRLLYGIAGNAGVEFTPNVSLNVDAGSLTDPGTNVFRGRRWFFTSAEDTALASVHQNLMFCSPVIIEKVWWNMRAAGGSNAIRLAPVLPGGAIVPSNDRTLFWRETYDADFINQNPPMFFSAFVAGTGGTPLYCRGVASTQPKPSWRTMRHSSPWRRKWLLTSRHPASSLRAERSFTCSP